MKTFNHAYTIAFSIVSNHREGDDIVPQAFRHAVLNRLAALTDDELIEAVGMPFDTYEET